jgi:hypothetical protein
LRFLRCRHQTWLTKEGISSVVTIECLLVSDFGVVAFRQTGGGHYRLVGRYYGHRLEKEEGF